MQNGWLRGNERKLDPHKSTLLEPVPSFRKADVSPLPSNRFVKVETQDATPIGTLMRLHTASGVSAFWVLLSDSVAGALIVLSLTGLLLWTRLHPLRLSAVAASLAALVASGGFLWAAI